MSCAGPSHCLHPSDGEKDAGLEHFGISLPEGVDFRRGSSFF